MCVCVFMCQVQQQQGSAMDALSFLLPDVLHLPHPASRGKLIPAFCKYINIYNPNRNYLGNKCNIILNSCCSSFPDNYSGSECLLLVQQKSRLSYFLHYKRV